MKRATSSACLLLLIMEGLARADEPPVRPNTEASPSTAVQPATPAATPPAAAQPSPPAAQPAAPASSPSGAAERPRGRPAASPDAPSLGASALISAPSDLSQVSLPSSTPADVLPPPSARPLLLLAGAGTFALWYGAALAESYAWPDARSAEKLRIPVVGPWMTLAKAGCAEEENGCTKLLGVVRGVLAGLSGVGQVGGIALLSEALLLRTAPQPARGAEQLRHTQTTATVKGFSFSTERDGLRVGVYGSF